MPPHAARDDALCSGTQGAVYALRMLVHENPAARREPTRKTAFQRSIYHVSSLHNSSGVAGGTCSPSSASSPTTSPAAWKRQRCWWLWVSIADTCPSPP